MESNTLDSSRKTSAMARADSSGKMAVSTTVVGNRVSNAALDYILISKALAERAVGSTAEGNAGLMRELLMLIKRITNDRVIVIHSSS